jgi:hypothetical protein
MCCCVRERKKRPLLALCEGLGGRVELAFDASG